MNPILLVTIFSAWHVVVSTENLQPKLVKQNIRMYKLSLLTVCHMRMLVTLILLESPLAKYITEIGLILRKLQVLSDSIFLKSLI